MFHCTVLNDKAQNQMAAGDRLGMQAKLSAITAKELPGTWWWHFPLQMNRLRGICPVAQHGC